MIDRRLLYVACTARYGSFTAAATRVGVTQSAITKSVADLERQLGYAIFNRTARGVILTEEGRNFVERASRLLEESRDLMRGASSTSDPYDGALRIGVCPATLMSLLVQPISTLMSRHPSIRLEITGGSYDKVVRQLRAGAIDVALGFDAAFAPHSDFRRKTVASFQAAYFVRKGHPLLEQAYVKKEDIARYDLIWLSSSAPYYAISHNLYSLAGIDVHDRLHIIEHYPIVEKLVRQTDAISIVSIGQMETAHFNKYFARLPFDHVSPPQSLCCATRLQWSPRPAVRAFIKACAERMPSADHGDSVSPPGETSADAPLA